MEPAKLVNDHLLIFFAQAEQRQLADFVKVLSAHGFGHACLEALVELLQRNVVLRLPGPFIAAPGLAQGQPRPFQVRQHHIGDILGWFIHQELPSQECVIQPAGRLKALAVGALVEDHALAFHHDQQHFHQLALIGGVLGEPVKIGVQVTRNSLAIANQALILALEDILDLARQRIRNLWPVHFLELVGTQIQAFAKPALHRANHPIDGQCHQGGVNHRAQLVAQFFGILFDQAHLLAAQPELRQADQCAQLVRKVLRAQRAALFLAIRQ